MHSDKCGVEKIDFVEDMATSLIMAPQRNASSTYYKVALQMASNQSRKVAMMHLTYASMKSRCKIMIMKMMMMEMNMTSSAL